VSAGASEALLHPGSAGTDNPQRAALRRKLTLQGTGGWSPRGHRSFHNAGNRISSERKGAQFRGHANYEAHKNSSHGWPNCQSSSQSVFQNNADPSLLYSSENPVSRSYEPAGLKFHT
jgi:hypothetical protein